MKKKHSSKFKKGTGGHKKHVFSVYLKSAAAEYFFTDILREIMNSNFKKNDKEYFS